MTFKQITTQYELAVHLDDILKGLKILSKKNPGYSIEHTIQLLNWNVGHTNCFLMLAIHRNRCVGFMFALAVTADNSWCEIMSVWSLPRLASRIKHEAMDILKKWCKDRNITTIIAQLSRNINVVNKSRKPAYLEWLSDLGFEPFGLVVKTEVH